MTRWRLGIVPYLNAAPLQEGLADEPAISLAVLPPASLAHAMAAGELDAALLPVAARLARPDLRLLAAPCIGSRGPVASVRLFLRRSLAEIRSVALDPDSLTSNALAKLLLRRRHDLDPEFRRSAADADARVMIGDPAIRRLRAEERNAALASLDLGAEWTDWTGLPFVFAAWLARPDVDAAALESIVAGAARRGLARRPEIAAREAASRGLEPAFALRYLTEHIRYDLDDDARRGLERFLSLCSFDESA